MTWDEIKKKRQKNTPGTSTLPWDEIKRSRGYTAPLEPEPIVMRSRPMQSSQEVIDRVKRDTGIQMPVPARTAAPSPTPSQIPTPTPTPPPTPTPTPTAAPAPTQYDGPLLKAYKPTGLQKVRDFFRKAGDKSKSAAYGVAEGLNSNALERLVENVLFRWNKQANNQLPKGWNAVGDVEREYKTLEPELKSQGYTAEQIKESKKAALDLARIQDDEKAYKAWMDKGPAWEPDKSDKIARTAGEIGGRVTGALYVSKILAPFVGAAGLPKGISDIIQGIGTGVITGATGAYGAGGDVGDVATAAGRNALFMAAGGLTSQAIGTGGSSLLSKMPALKNTIGADIGLNVLKGIGFGAAGTAATLPTYPKDQRPAGDEVIKNALVYGLFEGISSTMSTIAKAAQNKAAMNNAMRLFETDIKGKYNNARSIAGRNPAEALKLYASLLDDIDASTQALKQNRYVGAKDMVSQALDGMEQLKNYIKYEMNVVAGVANAATPGRFISDAAPVQPAAAQTGLTPTFDPQIVSQPTAQTLPPISRITTQTAQQKMLEALRPGTDVLGELKKELPSGSSAQVSTQETEPGLEQRSLYRYYLTNRPPGPGTFPGRATNLKSFDSRQYVDDIKQKAWGYVEFNEPLSEKQMRDYELVERNKIYAGEKSAAEANKFKSDLEISGVARNEELKTRILFEGTGAPEPQGYFYLEHTLSDGRREYGTERFNTIEQAQDAAANALVNKDETISLHFKKEQGITGAGQVNIKPGPDATKITQTDVQDKAITEKRLEQIEDTKQGLREAASETELKEFNKNQKDLYKTFYGMPEDADVDDIMDSLNIPSSTRRGFDYEQKYFFVRQLIEGYLGKGKLSDKDKIHIEIPNDGAFDIVNKPSKIAVVLDRLGIRAREVVPKGASKLISRSSKVMMDKEALTTGFGLFRLNEGEHEGLKRRYSNKIRINDISKLARDIFKHGEKARSENKVLNQPIKVVNTYTDSAGHTVVKKGYLIFTTQNGTRYAFTEQDVDFLNGMGVTPHIIPIDNGAFLIGIRDGETVGAVISTHTGSLDGKDINFNDTQYFMPTKGYFNKPVKKSKVSSLAMTGDPDEPMPIPEKREKVLPWPEDFPELVNMTNLTALKNPKSGNLELHRRAKAGDEEAAAELVLRVSKTPLIQELGRRFPNAMVAYVHAEESTGRNQLPNAYARLIGKIAGLEIAETLIQINRAQRTSKSSGERLFQPVYFDGPVIAGQEYILVDDVITQGGTIRGLREYIESNGGKVVAVSTLAMGRGKSPKTIAIKKETVQALYKKFGRVNINTALKEEGIANEATELTHAEGTYILHNFQHVDEIRSGSPEKRRNRIGQTDGRDSGTQDEGKRPDQVSDTQSYAPQAQAASIPESSGTSERSKTVDDIVQIIEKHTGVPIRTGRFRQRAYGIYKNQSRVIRTRVTNNLPVIAHELGHHFDRLYGFGDSSQFDSELLRLGAITSRSSYSKEQVRAEGVAEFLRLYLTNPDGLQQKAPDFLSHFESTIDKMSLEFLNQLRDDISQYANLPYNKRIYADISKGEGRKSTKSTRENVFQWVYDNWINDKGPFRRIQRMAEKSGYRGRNIDLATRTYPGLEAKVQNMFTDKQLNLRNQVVGPSLGEILEPINVKSIKKRGGDPIQEHQDFLSYLVSRRAVDYENRNLHMPQPYYVYKSNVTAMEKKYPHFKHVFDGLRMWEDNNFDLLVDSGTMAAKDAEEIRKNNPNHMPLHRIMEAIETHRAGAGKSLGQSKKVIKRATGSGKTIIDPLESIIADTYIIRRAAEANLILQDLKKAVESIEGFGDIMEAVPPGMRMTQFTVQDIKKQLKDMAENTDNKDFLKLLEEMTDEQLETSLKVFRPLMIGKDGDITIYEKGKPKLYLLEPELYRAIKGLNRQASHFIIRALNVPKRVLQAGAVTTVDFIMRNMARDTFTSLIQSDAGINPIDIFKGYVSAMLKDEHYKNYMRHGGGTDVFNLNTRQSAQLTEDELLGYDIGTMVQRVFADFKEMKFNNNERTRNKAWNSAKALLGLPFRTIRDAVGWSELGPRVAEYRKAREKGVNTETAAAWGRDLSVDFMQAGTLGREYNKIDAFFNAWIQGNTRIIESFKKHPYRTILRGLLYITLPTLVNYFINNSDDERRRAYEQLPEFRKALAWNIWIGRGRFVPVPKPYGYAWIFGSIPEVFLDKLRKNNPDAWKNLWEQFVANFDVDIVPSAVGPLVETAANRSWTGAPIESAADEQEFAYLRYNVNTSTLAKALGELTKDVNGGISPKKVDYLIRAYTASVGDFLWRLPDAGKNMAIDPKDVTQYPVVKKFVVDTAYSNKSMDRFYTYGQEITRYINEMEKGIPRAVKHLDNAELVEAVSLMEQYQEAYNAISKQFSEGRKAIRELEGMKDITVQQKKEAERAIRQGMNSAAYGFYQSYLEYKKKYKLK